MDVALQYDLDDYFVEAGRFIIEKEKASIGMLQRVYTQFLKEYLL